MYLLLYNRTRRAGMINFKIKKKRKDRLSSLLGDVCRKLSRLHRFT